MPPRSREETRGGDAAAAGTRAVEAACTWLRARSFAILERNYRIPEGEIDIIALDRETLCFVEVRSTSSSRWGGALASISDRKRRHLLRAARWYLSRLRTLPDEIRFDVVAIAWHGEAAPTAELVRGAFDASS